MTSGLIATFLILFFASGVVLGALALLILLDRRAMRESDEE